MKCSVCKGDLLKQEKVKSDRAETKDLLLGGGLILLGGPVVAALGGFSLAFGLATRCIQRATDEVEVTCPHCKAKLTLTMAEYKELEEELKAIKKEKRKAGQNRVEK